MDDVGFEMASQPKVSEEKQRALLQIAVVGGRAYGMMILHCQHAPDDVIGY
jgi:hypothetical protein